MAKLTRGRTEEQVDANQVNLASGRKQQRKLSPEERFFVQWPFGHKFPGNIDARENDIDDWHRWLLLGRGTACEFPASMDQDMRGWSIEMCTLRDRILSTSIFRGRSSIGLDDLLLRLGSKADSRDERRRRACEAVLNMGLFMESVIQTGSQEFPGKRKSWHDRIKKWEPGMPMSGHSPSRFHFLTEESPQVSLEDAKVFAPIYVAWESYVYSRAFAGSKGGVKSKQV